MKKSLLPISTAICAVLLFGGCSSGLHHHDDTAAATGRSEAVNPTLGQQLADLKKAYESKAISKKEYKEEKKRLLKDY
jgi:hypothetical protein